jgi:hypothetical protein
MPRFKAAHVREQGQDMIIFPLDGAFDRESDAQKTQVLNELEARANRAGLAGSAVAIWEAGGRTRFLGPRAWHGFLRSLSLRAVMASVNKEISWSD